MYVCVFLGVQKVKPQGVTVSALLAKAVANTLVKVRTLTNKQEPNESICPEDT